MRTVVFVDPEGRTCLARLLDADRALKWAGERAYK